jgi:hypothetical protein
MLFATALIASKGNDTTVTAVLIDAVSRDEAIGKALRLNLRIMPAKDGYHGHHVNASQAGVIVCDPDSEAIRWE